MMEVAILMLMAVPLGEPSRSNQSDCANGWSSRPGILKGESLAKTSCLFRLDFPTSGTAMDQPWAARQMCLIGWTLLQQPETAVEPDLMDHLIRL